MNPFLRYLADKNSAHTQTDRHTPMTTRPRGLRRAGNKAYTSVCMFGCLYTFQHPVWMLSSSNVVFAWSSSVCRHHHFWLASLTVHSTTRSQQSPEWSMLIPCGMGKFFRGRTAAVVHQSLGSSVCLHRWLIPVWHTVNLNCVDIDKLHNIYPRYCSLGQLTVVDLVDPEKPFFFSLCQIC